MIMKRIIFLVVTMLLCLCSYAQSFDFGVTGGLTVSDPRMSEAMSDIMSV